MRNEGEIENRMREENVVKWWREMRKWKKQKKKWALNPNGFFEPLSLPKIHPFVCQYKTKPI
jgi:hypothetical protein